MNFNPLDIMRSFHKMQHQLGEMQSRLASLEEEGSAGGGLVTMKINGQMEVTKVKIDPSAVNPVDLRMLEELIQAAFVDATTKIKETIRSQVSHVTGIPPDLCAGLPT